jgi:hypothetical protein
MHWAHIRRGCAGVHNDREKSTAALVPAGRTFIVSRNYKLDKEPKI